MSNRPSNTLIASTACSRSPHQPWRLLALALLLPVAALAAEPPTGDAAKMTRWEAGKRGLERALPPGRSRTFYRDELSRLGYQLRTADEGRPDTLAYEIVGSGYRYDVLIDVDQESGMATKVQVAPRLLKARPAHGTADRAQASQ
jgi:hypothetical protein